MGELQQDILTTLLWLWFNIAIISFLGTFSNLLTSIYSEPVHFVKGPTKTEHDTLGFNWLRS